VVVEVEEPCGKREFLVYPHLSTELRTGRDCQAVNGDDFGDSRPNIARIGNGFTHKLGITL